MDENDRQVLADEVARIEVDKLKAEIADLKHGGMVGARFARNGALITALFTAGGGVFALFQFNAQQEANGRNSRRSRTSWKPAGVRSSKKYIGKSKKGPMISQRILLVSSQRRTR